jgi:hypothetical protein
MSESNSNNIIIPIGISIFISALYGMLGCIRNNRRFRELQDQISQLHTQIQTLQQPAPQIYPPPMTVPMYPMPQPYAPQHTTISI